MLKNIWIEVLGGVQEALVGWGEWFSRVADVLFCASYDLDDHIYRVEMSRD